jgi:hypothetical protein
LKPLRDPGLSALHPDLVLGLQSERRIVERPEPNLDQDVPRVGRLEDARPAARAEAPPVEAGEIAAELERLDRPLRVDREGTPGFLPAVRAVAAPDVDRLPAHAVRYSVRGEPLLEAISQVKDVPVVPVELRPRPVEPVAGRRVAFFTTAPAVVHETLERHLEEQHGAEVAHVSGNLARRETLHAELRER